MRQLLSDHTSFVKTLAAGILVCISSFCVADDKEELVSTRALIDIVEGEKLEQSEFAAKLFHLIPANSNAKPVAAHALALIQIREQKYSDAWKALTSQWEKQGVASDSIKFAKEKLKLWLLLEAESAGKAEEQFKHLATMTLGANSAGLEQNANCGFIGGVVGMLKTDANLSCIPQPILDKVVDVLVAKVESKTAKSELEAKLMEASQWGAELSSLISKFESAGASKADEQNKSTQAELERTKQEQSKLRDDLKEAGGGKQELDEQRRKAFKDEKVAKENLQRERKNEPAPPVNPGPQPRKPDKPDGTYRTDPKTQERKYVEPTAKEKRDYEQKNALFNSWPARVAKFQLDSQQYPVKFQLWQRNLQTLEAQAKAAEDKVASIERAIKEMQEGIKQGVGKELKETGEEAKRLERFAAISNLAYHHIATANLKARSPIRPSNFQLIDYDSECSRMRKSLR